MKDTKQVEFAIAAPQIHTHLPVDTAEIRRYVQRAEALGFHSLWVQEQTNFSARASALEGVTMLAYVAALTERVRIGSAVFLITLRNPVHLAKSLVSLDQLSQGRLIVGVGLGPGSRARTEPSGNRRRPEHSPGSPRPPPGWQDAPPARPDPRLPGPGGRSPG